jgi:hypothetical protein
VTKGRLATADENGSGNHALGQPGCQTASPENLPICACTHANLSTHLACRVSADRSHHAVRCTCTLTNRKRAADAVRSATVVSRVSGCRGLDRKLGSQPHRVHMHQRQSWMQFREHASATVVVASFP